MSEARDIAKGHWKDLLPALGVDSKFLQNRHGPCPICGGDDRFRWDNREDGGSFICNHCGAGDGFSLAGRVTGLPFNELAERVRQMLGQNNGTKGMGIDLEEIRNRTAMERAWGAARSPSLDGPVATYLRNRVGCLWPSLSIREAFYGRHAGMVCVVIDQTGTKSVNVHTTLLNKDGTKADVEKPKMVMPGKLPDGCAIRLGPIKTVMGVAEGIETAISAAIMYDMPVWACINGTLLSKWIPPERVEHVTVFADNDLNYTGQAKAYHLANRLEVQHKRRTAVLIPPVPGQDWNDFWQEEHGEGNLPKTHPQRLPGFLRLVK
jgi:putative DNA primase/helicase